MVDSRTELSNWLTQTYVTLADEIRRNLRRNGASRSDADDVTSAAFALLLSFDEERLSQIENRRAYLHAMARNLHAQALAEQRRTLTVSNDELDVPVDSAELLRAEDGQLRQTAARAFAALSSAQQRYLFAATVQGSSAREIAEAEGISVTNATTLLSRARRDLRVAYVAELLSATPPPCGFDVPTLAQVIMGTAGARARRAYNAHVINCPSCPPLVSTIRQDLGRGGATLILAIVLGGIGTGLTIVGDAPSANAQSKTSPRRLLATLAGLLTAVALGAVALSGLPEPAPRPEPVPMTPGASAPPTGTLAAQAPSAVPLPAPGETIQWAAEVTSASEGTRYLFASTWMQDVSSADSAPPSLALTMRWGAGQVTLPHVETRRSGITYLGPINPGETLAIHHDVTRGVTDTDQHANVTLGTIFWVADTAPSGIAVGDTTDRPDELAATGTDGAVLALTALGGAVALLAGLRLTRSAPVLRKPPCE